MINQTIDAKRLMHIEHANVKLKLCFIMFRDENRESVRERKESVRKSEYGSSSNLNKKKTQNNLIPDARIRHAIPICTLPLRTAM